MLKKIRTLFTFLSKMGAYRRNFDKRKCMWFLMKDEKLLKKYNEIRKRVGSIIKKEFYSKLEYLKTKIKSYNRKINTNFHNNKIPKQDSQCICLPVILIDSVYRKDKDYYPQMFLEECKYVVKDKKMAKFITDCIEISSDVSDREILMKKILMKKIKYRALKIFFVCLFFRLCKFPPEI